MRKHKTPHGQEIEKGLVMARILATHFALLEWESMEYWDGTLWKPHQQHTTLPSLAPVLYHTGGGETSLQYSESLKVWYMLFVSQHDHNKMLLHYSEAVQGKWKSVVLYQPPAPFTDTEHYMCYAAKAHPGLAKQGEIVFSYVCTKRPWNWPGMTNVYVPQFVRVKITDLVADAVPEVSLLSHAEEQEEAKAVGEWGPRSTADLDYTTVQGTTVRSATLRK